MASLYKPTEIRIPQRGMAEVCASARFVHEDFVKGAECGVRKHVKRQLVGVLVEVEC